MKVTPRLLDIVSEARIFAIRKTINSPMSLESVFLGKYSELLVKECLSIVNDVQFKYSDDSPDEKEQVSTAIKTHFRMD